MKTMADLIEKITELGGDSSLQRHLEKALQRTGPVHENGSIWLSREGVVNRIAADFVPGLRRITPEASQVPIPADNSFLMVGPGASSAWADVFEPFDLPAMPKPFLRPALEQTREEMVRILAAPHWVFEDTLPTLRIQNAKCTPDPEPPAESWRDRAIRDPML